MVKLVKLVKLKECNHYFSRHNCTMDLQLIHIMLVHTFKHALIHFHNYTNQFIRFRFIMRNINIVYMHYNNFAQNIHII